MFMSEEIDSLEEVRSYRAPWKGQLVLVCRKCQGKLKHSGKKSGLAKLAKSLKKRSRRDESGLKLHVIQVPCLKMCPKGAVTVCTQGQLARGECSIVRTAEDVEALLSSAQHSITLSARPAREVSL
jgi:predicted metal-binding protein